jgi:chemotaxis protein MotB
VALALGYATWRIRTYVLRTEHELNAARAEVTSAQKARTVAEQELQRRRAENTELQANLTTLEASSRDLSALLAATDSRLAEFEQERDVVKERLEEFRKIAKEFRSMVDSGRLDVVYRRGRMVVALPAQLLFPSGSADLSVEGKASVTQVAKVLKDVRGRNFIVVGHTDNVPVSNEQFRNNWQLSTARALHVTQALISSGVPAGQLMSGGRAEFEPVASNTSERGRSKNRRIEIVLEPKLAELDGSLITESEAERGKRESGRTESLNEDDAPAL